MAPRIVLPVPTARQFPAPPTDSDGSVPVNAGRVLPVTGVKSVVKEACERAGVGRVGAHRLRHTAATRMLNAGASLPEIAQVLRHNYLRTTAIYAKVDRQALRPLALPWPGAQR